MEILIAVVALWTALCWAVGAAITWNPHPEQWPEMLRAAIVCLWILIPVLVVAREDR